MGHGQVDKIDFRKGLERALARVESLNAELAQARLTTREPIAVVGMACRFPGVANPSELWDFLMRGADAVRAVPDSRPDLLQIAELDPRTRWASVFDAVDEFDARFYGISPREATWLDPQQRLVLEMCTEAIDDAGLVAQRLEGTQTAVFLGMIAGPGYEELARRLDPSELDVYTFTGVGQSMAAGRVAHTLGLRGPALVVDTACSSSLVAVHLACQSLRQGECDLALAGGVSLILSAGSLLMGAKVTALSEDGRCRTFDAAANGIARGEGAGMVALKRLSDAVAEGDRVLAVVKGSAINHDGRAAGLGVPSVLAQEAVLRAALANAGAGAASIGFVETHGTGTSIGDPIELTALKNVLGAPRSAAGVCLLGAIKSNLGHTEASAGVTGFIKSVLALQHAQIPPNLHFRVLNPRVSLAGTPLAIPTQPCDWASGSEPRRAGVSSFGMSGTNAHVVLEEYTHAPRGAEPSMQDLQPSDAEAAPLLMVVSAQDAGALRAYAGRYAAHLQDHTEQSLPDVCFSAGHRRAAYPVRLAVVGQDRAQLQAALAAHAAGESSPQAVSDTALTHGPAKLTFVFSGMGSHWPGMGRQLYATQPAFRAAFDACSAHAAALTGESLVDLLLRAESDAACWSELLSLQLLLFSMQVSMSALWRSWGVEPDAVIGASLGEIAAAHVAGALSLADATNIVFVRASLLARQARVCDGGMLTTELTPQKAAALLCGYEDRVSIAAANSPRSTTLAGDSAALNELKARLDEQGEFCRWVKGAVGPGHSPAVDRILPELRSALAGLSPRPTQLAFYSTVTGALRAGTDLDAEYWARNPREPVAFGETLTRAIRDGHRLLLEVSPHPVLLPSMMQVAAHEGSECAIVASQRRNHDELIQLNEAMARLFVRGCPIDFRRRYPGARAVRLPTYPFQRKRFWVDVQPGNEADGARSVYAGHPLLGPAQALALPGVRFWQRTLSRTALPWLSELRLLGCHVLPQAVLIEMVAAAARSEATDGCGTLTLLDVRFPELPVLAARERPSLQLVLETNAGGARKFRIAQLLAGAAAEHPAGWRVLAEGGIEASADRSSQPPRDEGGLSALTGELYSQLSAASVDYGPRLQTLHGMRVAANGLSAELTVPAATTRTPHCWLEPATLEACFQAAVAAHFAADMRAAPGPARVVAIGRLVLRGPLPEQMRCQVERSADGLTILLRAESGGVLVAAEQVLVEPLPEALLETLRAMAPPPEAAQAAATDLLSGLREAGDPSQRTARMREYVRHEIARVLRAQPDELSDELPFHQQGLDSILGLELRNRFEVALHVELPATLIYTHQDIAALSGCLLEAIAPRAPEQAADPSGAASAASPVTESNGCWILRPLPRGEQAIRLFTFPVSGGTAASYVQWASRLPDGIELCAVELPGHGFHARRPAFEDFFSLIEALDRELATERGQPYALFGHSMGALVAFELARRFSRDGGRPPNHLFVSGLPAPQWFSTIELREAVAQNRLLDHLEKWGAVAPGARDEALLEMGMPALRSDLTALASWTYQRSQPLTCPLTALRSTGDPLTPLERMRDWRDHTSAAFRLETFPGGHFYLQAERARLLRTITDDLLPDNADSAAIHGDHTWKNSFAG